MGDGATQELTQEETAVDDTLRSTVSSLARSFAIRYSILLPKIKAGACATVSSARPRLWPTRVASRAAANFFQPEDHVNSKNIHDSLRRGGSILGGSALGQRLVGATHTVSIFASGTLLFIGQEKALRRLEPASSGDFAKASPLASALAGCWGGLWYSVAATTTHAWLATGDHSVTQRRWWEFFRRAAPYTLPRDVGGVSTRWLQPFTPPFTPPIQPSSPHPRAGSNPFTEAAPNAALTEAAPNAANPRRSEADLVLWSSPRCGQFGVYFGVYALVHRSLDGGAAALPAAASEPKALLLADTPTELAVAVASIATSGALSGLCTYLWRTLAPGPATLLSLCVCCVCPRSARCALGVGDACSVRPRPQPRLEAHSVLSRPVASHLPYYPHPPLLSPPLSSQDRRGTLRTRRPSDGAMRTPSSGRGRASSRLHAGAVSPDLAQSHPISTPAHPISPHLDRSLPISSEDLPNLCVLPATPPLSQQQRSDAGRCSAL
jgi:hypothetical protein